MADKKIISFSLWGDRPNFPVANADGMFVGKQTDVRKIVINETKLK